MTNYERIKNMSTEEMARFTNHIERFTCCCCNYTGHSCDNGKEPEICISETKKYLESEVEERLTPTADVAKVVRCKDCKHYEFSTACCKHFCNEYGGFVTENDYCSRAEKSDGIIREV